jgi:hypothetical protein
MEAMALMPIANDLASWRLPAWRSPMRAAASRLFAFSSGRVDALEAFTFKAIAYPVIGCRILIKTLVQDFLRMCELDRTKPKSQRISMGALYDRFIGKWEGMYEEAFFHLIEPLQRRSGLPDVALAGGCAMNSVANGKIRRSTRFRRV